MRLMVVIDSEGEKAWVNPLQVTHIQRCHYAPGEEPALISKVHLKGGGSIKITPERETATAIEWENAMRGLND